MYPKYGNKPPSGLIPPSYLEEYLRRYEDVSNAIIRYAQYSEYIKIPIEWIREYNLLCELLEIRK